MVGYYLGPYIRDCFRACGFAVSASLRICIVKTMPWELGRGFDWVPSGRIPDVS